MNIWGLHIIDVSVILLYIIVILWLGFIWRRLTKTDFLGFGGSWILVGVIILLLWVMTPIK